MPRALTLEAMERLLIRNALQRHNGNRAAAARELGINASTLFRKIRTQKLEQASRHPKVCTR